MGKVYNPTREVVQIRANLLELIVVAVVLALGVHFFAAGIVETYSAPPWVWPSIGVILSIGAACFVAFRSAPQTKGRYTFKGMVLSGERNEIISADRYEFSYELKNYISAISGENKAIGRIWRDNPLGRILDDQGKFTESPSAILLKEAIEYFFMNRLSLHLNSYFIHNANLKDIEDVGRRDIPSVLLENRFLDLFSRPMEEREAFAHHKKSSGGTTVFAQGNDGAIFENLELTLPRGTKISRLAPSVIKINTKRFEIKIEVEFDGFHESVDLPFAEVYLNRNYIDLNVQPANIYVDLKFKIFGLITKSGWEYFQWIDDFLTQFDSQFCFESYLATIGWNQALTAAYLARALEKSESSGRKRPKVRGYSVARVPSGFDEEEPNDSAPKKAGRGRGARSSES